MNIDWIGEVKGGKLRIVNEARFLQACAQLKEGRVILKVTDQSKRSTRQNAYLWGVVYRSLSDWLGYEVAEVHEICKAMFNPICVEVGDEKMIIGKSTQDMTTGEFEEYVDAIRRWATITSDGACYIPEPNE